MNNRLIVANAGNDTLTLVDLKNKYEIENIFLNNICRNRERVNIFSINRPCIGPHHIIKGSNDSIIYTANSYDNSVFKIDINKKTVIDTVYVGSCPKHLELLNGCIFVTNTDSNSVSVIDEKEFILLENIPVGEKPHDIKINNSENLIYVANSSGYSLSLIYLDSNKIDEIRLKFNPFHIIINKDKVYILCPQSNGTMQSIIQILDIKDNILLTELKVEGVILDMVVIEDTDILYTTNAFDGFLYKINIEKKNILEKYYLGGMPNCMLYNGDDLLFISDALKNCVTVFDYKKGKIIKNISVGLEPNGLILV
ncbi:hypothetical protein Y919_09415 [Caloranaerobacter azorensis H53214]|uniref:Surface antigen n=1 Tax=Caloranaerobacter azorensis H53214 TaxID=1156417 RepID=A0A096BFA3_9FIRM|nr:YncE family protein [Caloranaerobacter azorensis]KGG79880.1 hypothetical protein Y919_09415 [Caloranaerobacter azorensis H53214]